MHRGARFRAARGEGEEFRTLEFVRKFVAEAGFEIVTRDDPRYYVPYHVHGVRGAAIATPSSPALRLVTPSPSQELPHFAR